MATCQVTMDGNEAAAHIAFKTNEVIAIYPITPATPMGEWADLWRAQGQQNIWGAKPAVMEMQAEGGAAGAAHGALQAGALTTTFTASQGLLLMIPNMYKIAGELTSTVFHIAARSVAAQALSIFGDHSDVMAARGTGWGFLFSNSVQEVMDFALISQACTLAARVPFLHIFDGFRTSHEIQKIEVLSDDDIKSMIDMEAVMAHRSRALSPDRPFIRGTAQNPDVFFQARESVNPYYLAVPGIVERTMGRFFEVTRREYHLFDYTGAPDAHRVIVMMGSGCETAEATVTYLCDRGEKVGLVKVRLYRPFSVDHFLRALPPTVKVIAALDRTKEPGSAGEPLYQDILTAVMEASGHEAFATLPRIIGGRYGLSSKEFTPAMVAGLFDEMRNANPKNHFTLGILDDVTHTSLEYPAGLDIEPEDVTRAMFWGLGSDGTVGANKNTIKIIGEGTDLYAQGYFVYDSRKAGARTISHLRFGSQPIHSTYLIDSADFVAVHQFGFLDRYDTLAAAREGATFLLNAPYAEEAVWDRLPRTVQAQIIEKKLRFFVIDAYAVARERNLGVRINTIMQTCFFALSGVLPPDDATVKIKEAIQKTYGKRGSSVVKMNFDAVDAALEHLHEITIPDAATSTRDRPAVVPDEAPDFVRNVTAKIMAGLGDELPVSALPDDGTYPSGTTQWERRNIAQEVPVWEPDICIQCGKCVMVCPHAVIRAKVVPDRALVGAPEGFETLDAGWRGLKDQKYTLQVAVEDCTGCKLCVEVCPAKDKSNVSRKAINMAPRLSSLEKQKADWAFFKTLPEIPRVPSPIGDPPLKFKKVKDVQLLEPLFEFSGACAGCGETPYIRLLTQLFGERALVANATGCSSIYGGNLPTTPWSLNKAGRGPAWSNSLFEDNAEFGLGMRLTVDQQQSYARSLVVRLRDKIGIELADDLLAAGAATESEIAEQRARVEILKSTLKDRDDLLSRDLFSLADFLTPRSVWIVGGDGWAYDIGYGGLDHVLASGRNVNILVLDTEVYSNTGGQASKATALGAVAKFAAGGKPTPKKDLGRLAMSYGYVYVAQVAMGADANQTIKSFEEAESYHGPSLIIAYSHCIAHGIDMAKGMDQQHLATVSGYWPLYRFDPRVAEEGKNPLRLDSRPPSIPLKDYIYNEARYRVLRHSHPDDAEAFLKEAQTLVDDRWVQYKRMAAPREDTAAGDTSGPSMPPSKRPAKSAGDGSRGTSPATLSESKLPPTRS